MLSEKAIKLIQTIKGYGKSGMPVHGKFGKEEQDELVNAGVAYYGTIENGALKGKTVIHLNPVVNQPEPTTSLSLTDILFWNDPDQPTDRTPEKVEEMALLEAKSEQRKAQNNATIQAILSKGYFAATSTDWQILKELGAADYDYDYSDDEGEAMPLKLKKGYAFQIPDTDLWASGD